MFTSLRRTTATVYRKCPQNFSIFSVKVRQALCIMQVLHIMQGFCKASKIDRDAISCLNKLKHAETNVIIKRFLTWCPMNYAIEEFLRLIFSALPSFNQIYRRRLQRRQIDKLFDVCGRLIMNICGGRWKIKRKMFMCLF